VGLVLFGTHINLVPKRHSRRYYFNMSKRPAEFIFKRCFSTALRINHANNHLYQRMVFI
jgi:hypothetical protein